MATQCFDFLLQSTQLLIIGLLQCLQLVSDFTASDVNLFEAIFIEQLIGAVAIEDGLEISNRVMICDAHQYLTKIIQMAQAACSLQGAYPNHSRELYFRVKVYSPSSIFPNGFRSLKIYYAIIASPSTWLNLFRTRLFTCCVFSSDFRRYDSFGCYLSRIAISRCMASTLGSSICSATKQLIIL